MFGLSELGIWSIRDRNRLTRRLILSEATNRVIEILESNREGGFDRREVISR